jgi:hypothetical protein
MRPSITAGVAWVPSVIMLCEDLEPVTGQHGHLTIQAGVVDSIVDQQRRREIFRDLAAVPAGLASMQVTNPHRSRGETFAKRHRRGT